jgi:hypothetical protein
VRAGFDFPHLFIDGTADGASWSREFGLEVTARGGNNVKAYGHWVLSLAELYIRKPTATHYAVFQDDFLTYSNLRQYLERALFPQKAYLNLYTFPSNTPAALRTAKLEAPQDGYRGFYRANQRGKGAVALIFRRDAVVKLLTQQGIVERPMAASGRGTKNLDGAVVTAMQKIDPVRTPLGEVGWEEYVHYPTLTLHIGMQSSIGNRPHEQGVGFLGEEYDALQFLKG